MKNKAVEIAILILVLIGQVHLICNYMAGFIPWLLVFIVISLGTAFLIFLIIITTILTSRQKKVWNAPISITLIIGLAFGFLLSNYQDSQREINAEILIEALDQYKFDKGEYPISDKYLIPKYLSKIPTNSWGLQNIGFCYTTAQNRAVFSIEYNCREGYEYYYSSSMEVWQFGD
jgi:glucan phosphoethanolaminetransferase (alkaline phosphatase superfamily)